MRAQYFHVNLTQCDYRNVSPMGMVRLIACEKVFFFNQDDFSNSEIFLERIQQGDSLIICAEEMNDGSYWVKWVYHEKHGRLEPDRTVGFTRKLGIQYLVSLLLMMLIPAVYYCFINADDSFLMIILVAILGLAAFGGIVLFGLALAETKYILSPKRKRILKALDLVIDGQYQKSEQEQEINIPGIKTSKAKARKLRQSVDNYRDKASLLTTRGKVNITSTLSLTVARGDTEQKLNHIGLQINKSHMDVLVSANEPLFNNHNLFIAQGDELEVFHKNIQAHSKDQVIFGIYNHQDGLAYSLIGKGAPQERGFYFGLWGFVCLLLMFFVFMAGGLSISETLEKGGYWDYWDWVNIVDTGVLFISFAVTILFGISFLIALCVAIYFKLSQRGSGYYQAQYILKHLRRNNGQTDYVTEVRS
ncbi:MULTISPECIES: hypothetical protein [Providencia]|uniref:Uncharacterized protein n=1 Tax=Providencia huaxiensis TaxID=2027290 RepID=A0ABU2J2A1_9GAMM|nr:MULTISPECIES: hypothetical protein [Providencia]MDT0135040.1 hypothetical protein [Providencia huaxiensis]MDT1981445.1 hypothetical protein [Providencia huaxiensis]